MTQTLDDLVALLPAPGTPPIQLHLDGALALIVQADGAVVYVNGPAVLRYFQRTAPILATVEALGEQGLDAVDVLLEEGRAIDAVFGNRQAFDGMETRVEKVRFAVTEAARMHSALLAAEAQAAGCAAAYQKLVTEAATRIRTLASALHRYGQHEAGCVEGDPVNRVDGCTCGLAVVLASEPDPQTPETPASSA